MCSAIFGSVIDLETADAGDSDDDDNAELFGWLPNLRVCKLEGLCSDIFRHLRIHFKSFETGLSHSGQV